MNVVAVKMNVFSYVTFRKQMKGDYAMQTKLTV